MGFALADHILEVAHIRASLSITVEGCNHTLAVIFQVASSKAVHTLEVAHTPEVAHNPEVDHNQLVARNLEVIRRLVAVHTPELIRTPEVGLEVWHLKLVTILVVGHHSQVVKLVVIAHILRSPRVIGLQATTTHATMVIEL